MSWLQQLFGLFKAFQFWIVIAPWEAGLRVRFGKKATLLSPGPHLRLPFMDRVFVQPVRLRTISDCGQTMATRDGKVLTLSIAVSYAIEDIRALYLTVSNPEYTLLAQIQGAIAEIVANTASDVLTPRLIEDLVSTKVPATEWGLSQVKLMVVSYAYAKTFRIMNCEYSRLSNANELEQPKV